MCFVCVRAVHTCLDCVRMRGVRACAISVSPSTSSKHACSLTARTMRASMHARAQATGRPLNAWGPGMSLSHHLACAGGNGAGGDSQGAHGEARIRGC